MRIKELGWNAFLEAEWNSRERERTCPARVIGQHRQLWEIAGEFGETRAEASGKLRLSAEEGGDWPVVGDWAAVSGDAAIGMVIREVLPRRTQIARKAAGRRIEAQVLAANVDTVFVVMGLDGDWNTRRLERYLAQLWESGARMVVLLNKADLCRDPDQRAEQMRGIAWGVDVVCISAMRGDGIARLGGWLRCGETVVLLGSSGVGKSTLLNLLLKREEQNTAAVRSSDSRGRHTTTVRELFFLPTGAMVIDTPGLRELQLWDAQEGLEQAFADVQRLAHRCRFRSCTHAGEPGCAVAAAIREGELDEGRFANQRKLLREQAFLERKVDWEAQQRMKSRVKTIHRAARELYRRRDREGKQ